MANLTPWARWCADAQQKIADAIGHGMKTNLGFQCLNMAEPSLDAARRAQTPGDQYQTLWTNELSNSLSAMKIARDTLDV